MATQLVYPVTLVTAMLIRKTEWRGARYRIAGPWEIHLESYPPFRDGQRADTRCSL
jgi:hypothetical protein